MVSFIAISCNYIFGTLLTANGSLKSLNILAVFGIIINIFLNLFLIPESGSVGAAFASAFTQFFILIVQFILCFKYFKFNYHIFSIIQILSFTLFSILGAYNLNILSSINWNYKLLITVLMGFIFGMILKLINLKEFYQLIKTSKS